MSCLHWSAHQFTRRVYTKTRWSVVSDNGRSADRTLSRKSWGSLQSSPIVAVLPFRIVAASRGGCRLSVDGTDVGGDHRSRHLAMAEKLLDGSDVVPGLPTRCTAE
jgi:hypothetical protein